MNWIQYKTIPQPPTGQMETIAPRLEGGKLFLDRGNQPPVEVPAAEDGWHRIPYWWGLTIAAAYARAEDGEWAELVAGLGEHAPMPTWRKGVFVTGSECDL
jgi:hypothetical protein